MMRPNAFLDSVTGAACDAMVVPGGVGVAVAGVGCADAGFDAAITAVLGVTTGASVPPVDAMAVIDGLGVAGGLADIDAVAVADDVVRLGVADREAPDTGTLDLVDVGVGFGVGVVGFELVVGDDVGLGAVATGVAHPTMGYPSIPQMKPLRERKEIPAARMTAEPWLWIGTSVHSTRPEGVFCPWGAS